VVKNRSDSPIIFSGVRREHIPVATIVDALCAPIPIEESFARARHRQLSLPSRDRLYDIVDALRAVFFPGYFGTPDLSDESRRFYVGATLDRIQHPLSEQIYRDFRLFCDQPRGQCDCQDRAHAAAEKIGRAHV
jgi:serine O-acetyltransferase